MIIDVTGTELTPGNGGVDCLGNGHLFDASGVAIKCCCDECDYLICCSCDNWQQKCDQCHDRWCPRLEAQGACNCSCT